MAQNSQARVNEYHHRSLLLLVDRLIDKDLAT